MSDSNKDERFRQLCKLAEDILYRGDASTGSFPADFTELTHELEVHQMTLLKKGHFAENLTRYHTTLNLYDPRFLGHIEFFQRSHTRVLYGLTLVMMARPLQFGCRAMQKPSIERAKLSHSSQHRGI